MVNQMLCTSVAIRMCRKIEDFVRELHIYTVYIMNAQCTSLFCLRATYNERTDRVRGRGLEGEKEV